MRKHLLQVLAAVAILLPCTGRAATDRADHWTFTDRSSSAEEGFLLTNSQTSLTFQAGSDSGLGAVSRQTPSAATGGGRAYPNEAYVRKAAAPDVVWVENIEFDKMRYSIFSKGNEYEATMTGWVDSYDFYPEIVVPDAVDYNGRQVPVTEIGIFAFNFGYGITGVKIGANVTTIAKSAFFDCNITELTIPQNVRLIDESAFEGCPLTTISFENPSVQSPKIEIGTNAFATTDITDIEFPARLSAASPFVTNYGSCISNCQKLKAITINPAYKQSGYYGFEIISGAFCGVGTNNNGNRTVTVFQYPPQLNRDDFTLEAYRISVVTIAFYESRLKSISLTATAPKTEGKVTMVIDDKAFAYSSDLTRLHFAANGNINLNESCALCCYSLSAFSLGSNVEKPWAEDGILFSQLQGRKFLWAYPTGRTASGYTVPEDVKCINDDAFYSNQYLTTVTLPDGLEGIGSRAFANCSRLTTVDYHGTGLKEAGLITFRGTPYFDNMPEGPVMLAQCLIDYQGIVPEHLVLPDNIHYAALGVFRGREEPRSVILPKYMETIPDMMFSYCNNLTEVQWPENLKEVGVYSFASTNLNEIVLPPSCLRIKREAFSGNVNTVKIRIGDFSGITAEPATAPGAIGAHAFANFNACRDFQMGRGFARIYQWAFSYLGTRADVAAQQDLVIPEGTETIDKYAFMNACGFGNIYLPSSLKTLGYSALFIMDTPKEVVIKRLTPPSPPEDEVETPYQVFSGTMLAFSRLVIPADADPADFTSVEAWNFANIEQRDLSAVEKVESDASGLLIDGLSVSSANGTMLHLIRPDGIVIGRGERITAPCSGLYIVSSSAGVRKILL